MKQSSPLIESLRGQLRELERVPATKAGDIGTLGPPWDRCVPRGAVRPGLIVEWLTDHAGDGGGALACQWTRHFLERGGALVIVDDDGEFYSPAAARYGLSLDRTIVVRPSNHKEVIWTLEQSLRCRGVAATWCRLARLADREFRRLQLAAETGGGLGLFFRPATARAEPTWADLRWLVQPVAGGTEFSSSGRRIRLELLHCRVGTGGAAVLLDIDDEGAVHLVPELAAPTARRRPARA